MIFVSSEEIRQFLYCKRIIYFRRILRIRFKPTVKMEIGSEKHEKIRIKGRKNVYLCDDDLGLCAIIDVLKVDDDGAAIIEVKTGNLFGRKISYHHKMQVVAQAYLVEKVLGINVKEALIYDSRNKRYYKIEISEKDYNELLGIMKEIKEIIAKEIIPDPSSNKNKCIDCEFRKLCMDISIPKAPKLSLKVSKNKSKSKSYVDLSQILITMKS